MLHHMTPRQIVTIYFCLQALATICWWALLVAYPLSIKWFQPRDWPVDALLSFWLADLILIVAGSLIAATGVWCHRLWSPYVIWTVAAVTWYPTLVCIATSIKSGEAWVASTMMVTMAGLSLAMATIHGNATQTPATFRVTPMNSKVALFWTLGQIIVFWGTFLWILPLGIVELERHFVRTGFRFSFQSEISTALFLAASCLGIWSAITMAIYGDGTPLPTATCPNLVIVGPYRYVRNPMALAGIVQGMAVGIYLCSYFVVAYSLQGAFFWHYLVRPGEERDLIERFGESYDHYRSSVRLWFPRFTETRPK